MPGRKKSNALKMKSKLILLVVAGLLASTLAVSAQVTTPTPDTNAPAPATGAPTTVTAATNVTTSVTTSVTTNAAPASASSASADATPPTRHTGPGRREGATATATANNNSNAARDPNAEIPLIVMDEVPLTDAIKNLARQAGLNYMLDQKSITAGPAPMGSRTCSRWFRCAGRI